MKNAKTQSFVPFGKRLATGLLRFSLVCCPVIGALMLRPEKQIS